MLFHFVHKTIAILDTRYSCPLSPLGEREGVRGKEKGG